MMTPPWTTLIARERGLKPSSVEVRGEHLYLRTAQSLWDPPENDTIPALCRDAAVRWLLGEGCYVDRWNNPEHFRVFDSVLPPHKIADEESLDAALFAAVAAVLDARDAHAQKI